MVSLIRRTHPDRDWTASEGSFLTPERLENFDIVVLGDMEGNYLAGPEYDALREWVDAGHALLVLGGYRSFGPSGWRATPLAEILPVVFRSDGPTQSEEPFVVELTAKGRAHPMFEITGDRVKDAALWQSAPPLLGSSLVEGVKPGADVLAVNPNAGGEDAPVPVAVVQRYGAGHTVVLAVDTTWRWSRFTRILGRSDALFARFWSQTVRWLAGRDQRSAAVPLTVTTDRPWYELGDTVTLRAAGGAPADADRSGVAISAEITEPDGRTVPVALRAAGVAALSGVFRPASGGRYEAVAVMTVEDGPAIAERTEFMVYSAGVELADVRSHPDRLRSIAAATGGEYVDIGEAAGMADRIPRRERTNRYTRRREIWNSPVLFLFFLAAVTAEWVLRRRNHLV